jgi:hypothetical protein
MDTIVEACFTDHFFVNIFFSKSNASGVTATSSLLSAVNPINKSRTLEGALANSLSVRSE